MSYFSQLGLGSSGTGYAGGWRKGDVADSPQELHILCTGKIEQGGEVDWDISPLPTGQAVEDDAEFEALLDGALQAVIDHAAELQELIDGRLDDEYHASGNW